MRPASRMESFRLSLPPGTLDSWNMPPHRRGAVSVHVRSVGLRRNQSSVLSRRIPLTRIGSSVSARTRGESASVFRTTWCKRRLSPRACSRTARRLIELTTSRSNLSSGFIWRNASRAGGSEREVPRAFAVRLAPTAVLLTSSDTGGRRAMDTAGGTKGISTNQSSSSPAPGSINPSLAIIARDRQWVKAPFVLSTNTRKQGPTQSRQRGSDHPAEERREAPRIELRTRGMLPAECPLTRFDYGAVAVSPSRPFRAPRSKEQVPDSHRIERRQ